jgi:SAM-dependent methyltransferase
MPPACHLCHSPTLLTAVGSDRFRRVTSDCKPWPPGGSLSWCEACATVQAAITPQWTEDADRIYRDYQVYHQGGGVEQAVFDTAGAGSSRSSRLIERLAAAALLPRTGHILDVGCGNGTFLRAFGGVYPDWSLFGAEYDERNRAALEAIPGFRGLHAGPPSGLPGPFDFITLVHTLEHLVDPTSFLATIRPHLKPGGRLFIQVPSYPENPFELFIADHASHFDAGSLSALLVRSGFAPTLVRTDWIGKELSALATPVTDLTTSTAGGVAASFQTLSACLAWLEGLLDRAAASQSASPTFGLFGSSIAATWTAANLPSPPDFFVDEDDARIGRTHMGRPILCPARVPAEAAVFVALPPGPAGAVRRRLSATSPGHWRA